MKRVAAHLLTAALAFAQVPGDPIFRSDTRLVQVDVVVKAGEASVKGLTKNDFQILDNGNPQQIAVFSVRDAASLAAAATNALPKGVVTNGVASRELEPAAATVILIDGQNTYPEDQGFARSQALKYLDRATGNESIAIYSLGSKLNVLQDFTSDRAALRRAVEQFMMVQSLNLQDGQFGILKGLTGNAANAMRAASFERQARITTSAFESIARSMQGLPGRKKLIWITAAIPLTFTLPREDENGNVVGYEYTNLSTQLFDPAELLNAANIAVYPVDPRGVMFSTAGLADPGIATMIGLARLTGGKAFYNDNAVAAGIEAAIHDTDLTYSLGFYPAEEPVDGQIHSISVKVKRDGVQTRYRQSYTAETRTSVTAEYRKATLDGWISRPVEATDIPLQAAATPALDNAAFYDVGVSIDLAALKLEEKHGRFAGAVDLVIVLDTGEQPEGLHQTLDINLTQERLREALETGYQVVSQIRVADDKGKRMAERLRVVVMDRATGKAGSVRIPIGQP